jgi:hypothetical protein
MESWRTPSDILWVLSKKIGKNLHVVEFTKNNSWHASIQNTPFMLNYGQNPDDPTIAWLRECNPAVSKLVGRWSEQLVRARELLRAAQDKYK